MPIDPLLRGINRSDSTNASNQLVHGLKVANVFGITNEGAVVANTHHLGEMVHIAGIPTRMAIRIANGITTTGVWPKHGTNESDTLGSQAGASSTEVLFPTGHTAAKGMALMVMTGSGRAGQARLINSVSGNTITVNIPWGSQPQSGDSVHVGILSTYANYAYLKSEFSVDTRWIRGSFLWYGMPLDMDAAQAAPVVFADDTIVEARTLNATDGTGASVAGFTTSAQTAGQFHGNTLVRRALGPAMFRFQVLVAPASGTVSLWADVG